MFVCLYYIVLLSRDGKNLGPGRVCPNPTEYPGFESPDLLSIKQFLNFPQTPTPPPSVEPPPKRRCFSPNETTASLTPPPPPPYVGFGYEDEFYQVEPNIEVGNKEELELELKEQISNLDSFLELETAAAAATEAVTTQVSGSGAECDPVDLWMLDDIDDGYINENSSFGNFASFNGFGLKPNMSKPSKKGSHIQVFDPFFI
ncbi:hypothetical protein LWI29_031121 [Acer saccharum]|uniref:Uncharacterized protein n=1 Tax=Acer saccharum TaxID=4024 RepID=A0AA39RTJ7_ACESA|nr:hypothetical protein LWI29_031121 [Acer saccharum]